MIETERRETFKSGTGSFTVSERGGRIIDLRAGGHLPNVFFEKGLESVSGGDRMWLAPEMDVLYEDRRDPSSWRCPPELDPGSWKMTTHNASVDLQQEFLGARMVRRVSPVQELPIESELPWAGYTVISLVRTAAYLSAWQLAMFPAPCSAYVVACGGPIGYYEPVPLAQKGWMRADDHPPRWKAGFAPKTDGRTLLACMSDAEPGSLVVMTSLLDSSGTYIDAPPEGEVEGTAVQIFSSGGKGFMELEFHAPLEKRSLQCDVLCFWGDRPERLRALSQIEESGR